jgi:hypothetical protein
MESAFEKEHKLKSYMCKYKELHSSSCPTRIYSGKYK